MSDVWYYAASNNSVGPLSKATLVEALSRMQEPKNTLVWRSGFADWKKASEISELLPYVAKPPPLPPALPPSTVSAGEPSVSAADDLEPKDIGQSIAYTIVGGIWVAYILKSKRVANTFVK
jgi:type IV pilus assembly protein PilA